MEKTYELAADVNRVVFTRRDGVTVELTGSYTTDNVEEQEYLDQHDSVAESGKKAK